MVSWLAQARMTVKHAKKINAETVCFPPKKKQSALLAFPQTKTKQSKVLCLLPPK
jgi:hypothetical protein